MDIEEKNSSKKVIKANWAFSLYFSVMFCLYTNTYIQLMAQIGILLYVMIPFCKKLIITKKNMNDLISYLLWFGLFTTLLFLSKYWAYDVIEDSKTMLTTFRIFIIGFIIFLYCDSKEKIYSVLYSFIIGSFIMSILALVTTPISNYGKEQFGRNIGQHRNQIGAGCTPLIFLCILLNKNDNFKYGKTLALFFTIIVFVTGSRTSVLQIIMIYLFIILFNKEKLSQKTQKFFVFFIILIFGIIIIYNIPFLYNVIWIRIENAIYTILGVEVLDTSALGREFYKDIAYIMFKQKPILGFGLDGFKCFVRDNHYMMGTYMREVYAHCNYAEIVADLGIVGLLIWYTPILTLLKNIFKIRKTNIVTNYLFAIFLSMVILDYSRIPWATHYAMYILFIVIILIKNEIYNQKKEKKK